MEVIPLSDIVFISIFGISVFITAYYTEKFALRKSIKHSTAKRILHVYAIGLCAILAGVIENAKFLILLSAIAGVVVFYFVQYRNFFNVNGKKNWGFVYFPGVFVVLLYLFAHHRFLVVAPMGLLALADAAAGFFGERYGRVTYSIRTNKKTWIGSLAFIVVAFLLFIVLRLSGFEVNTPLFQYLIIAVTVAIICAIAEATGRAGRDNIWIPGLAAFVLYHLCGAPKLVNILELDLWILVFIPGAYLVYKLKLLTAHATILALLIGITILVFGRLSLFPILTFFITGSLLSRLPGKIALDIKAGNKARDAMQVFCTGGIPLLLALVNSVWPNEKLALLYLVACAVSSADTWGSELGTRLGRYTIDIVRWRRVSEGLSGGVSFIGFLATFLGAGIIALFGFEAQMIIKITLLGVLGSVIDSILGSVLQAKYQNEKGEITDLPTSKKVSGFETMNNDIVNLISIGLTVAIAYFVLF